MELPQVLQVRGDYAVVYTDKSYLPRKNRTISLLDNFKNAKTYSGEVTTGAQKRIRKSVSILLQRSPNRTIFNSVTLQNQNFKVGFLTLTIPDLTTLKQSHYYKILLKPYLRILKNKFDVKDYIWKAELQKRGSLHYHLTINKFVPFFRLRDIWNELLDKNGLMENYKLAHGNSNPNSIDIHSVKNIANLEAYLTKYISKKSDDDLKLVGKVWGCSDTISNADYYSEIITADIGFDIQRAKDLKLVSVLNLEQCTIIRLLSGVLWQDINLQIKKHYNNWLIGVLREPAPALHFVRCADPPPEVPKGSLKSKQFDLWQVN